MKKLLPLLLFLLLSACATPPPAKDDGMSEQPNQGTIVSGTSCTPTEATHPESYAEEWQDLHFDLPWCWSMEEGGGEFPGSLFLELTRSDKAAHIFVWTEFSTTHSTYKETLQFGNNTYDVYDREGRNIYALKNSTYTFEIVNPSHVDVQNFLTSVKTK